MSDKSKKPGDKPENRPVYHFYSNFELKTDRKSVDKPKNLKDIPEISLGFLFFLQISKIEFCKKSLTDFSSF
jgi:hypothetical protein